MYVFSVQSIVVDFHVIFFLNNAKLPLVLVIPHHISLLLFMFVILY